MSRTTTSRSRQRIAARAATKPRRWPWLKLAAARGAQMRWVDAPGAAGVANLVSAARTAQRVVVWVHTYYWLMRHHLSRSRYEPKRAEGSPAWRRARHAA